MNYRLSSIDRSSSSARNRESHLALAFVRKLPSFVNADERSQQSETISLLLYARRVRLPLKEDQATRMEACFPHGQGHPTSSSPKLPRPAGTSASGPGQCLRFVASPGHGNIHGHAMPTNFSRAATGGSGDLRKNTISLGSTILPPTSRSIPDFPRSGVERTVARGHHEERQTMRFDSQGARDSGGA